MCQVDRHLFAIPVENYVDDYCCPSFKAPDGGDFGAAAALATLHQAPRA